MDTKDITDILTLTMTIFNVLIISVIGLRLTIYKDKRDTFDKIYQLYRERFKLLYKYHETKDGALLSSISGVQLQTKHLLFEANRRWNKNLCQSQLRIMAECFDTYCYYDLAEQYWAECFKLRFPNDESESEYHREHARFLYNIGQEQRGEAEFKNALDLPNTNNGRYIINSQTYETWIRCLQKMRNSYKYDIEADEMISRKIILIYEQAIRMLADLADADVRERCIDDLKREASVQNVSSVNH